jgi:hypothetical protein
MKSKIPDNVVYSVEEGFNANILPYATKRPSNQMMLFLGKVEALIINKELEINSTN